MPKKHHDPMAIGFTRTAVTLKLLDNIKDELVKRVGSSHLYIEYNEKSALLLIRRAKPGEVGGATAGKYRSDTTSEHSCYQWHRRYLSAKTWPVFGQTPVEMTYNKDGTAVIAIPKNTRPLRGRLMGAHLPRKKTEANGAHKSSDADTLQTMRDACGALNRLLSLHPNEITYRIKVGGKVGFEWIAEG